MKKVKNKITTNPKRFSDLCISIAFMLLLTQSSLGASENPANQNIPSPLSMLNFGRPCNSQIDPVDAARKRELTSPMVLPDHPLATPTYPPTSKHEGQEGTSMLQIYVIDDGRVGEVRLQRSSGWPLLDSAAMESTRDWTLRPGKAYDKVVCAWVTVPVVFKLQDYDDEELAAAHITPQAEALARLFLGENELQVSFQAHRSEMPAMEGVVEQLISAVTGQSQWRAGVKNIAAMLAIEFSPEELLELNKNFSTPEARKFFLKFYKFDAGLRRQRQRLATIITCETNPIAKQLEYEAGNSNLATAQKKLLGELPRVLKDLEPYCGCMSDVLSLGMEFQAAQKKCGEQPRVSW